MFHLVFSLTSRFLYLRNILQGFARGILALRSLDTISSYLAPALSPPPPVPLLDAPAPFVDHPEQIILPYPSRDVIAIERQLPVFASPFPIYQSSLIAVTPSQFPKFLPLLVILAVISGFVVVLPEITYSLMNIAKSFKSKSTFYRLPTSLPSQFASFNLPISLISLSLLCTGPPVIATFFAFVWFMSILFSYEQVSNMIVAILQWCGLLIVQDTRTPPLLDAIYEQITRGAAGYSDLLPLSDLSDEHNKYQVITDYSLGYSHLAAQLSAHDLGLQSAPMRREDQEPEVSVQRIQTESVNSQNLHRQPELSHAREQKLDADLLASEQERERLIALVSALEGSRKDKQAWKKIAAISKSFYAEAEMTASNLRTDLEVATGRVRNVQEQLDHQIELVSGKDSIIQSITKESQLAHTRFRLERDRRVRETKELLHEKVMARHRYEAATDRVRNLQEQLDHQIELASGKDSTIQSITKESRLANTRLRLERDRRVRETKEFLHEKGMIRRHYESEMRRLTQEAQDAQEQLDALRDTLSQLRSDRQSSLDRDQPLRNQPPTTWPFDTGRPPLPPEWNLDTGTSPVSPAIDPDSSHGSTKSTPQSPIQVPMDSSTRLATRLLEIPGVCDQESEVPKEQRAALVELIERMRQVEPESAVDVKPNERDETRLQEELIATKEQLRLAEEDVRDLRRELGQSRESLHDAETRVRALENELDICQATVREAQDAQYAREIKFTEATQLLRVRQAESESSMARAEESEFKCSQVIFLCAALRERVTELEAKVKKSKSVRKYRAHSNSRSRRPTGTCTAVAHDPGIREFDSIYMTVPPSMPRLIDVPLPPSSSPSNDSSLYINHQECPPIPLASADSGSCYPTDPDPESNTHDTHAQTSDLIVLTAPPSLPSSPRLLDVSLPQSSSLMAKTERASSPLCYSHQMRPAIPPTCTDSHSFSPEDMDLDFSTPNANSQILDSPLSSHASTNLSNLLPPSQSEDFSLPSFSLSGTFLSERNSLGSVDWPPIGSSLLPEHGNARQDDNISLRSPTKGNGNELLSPIKELDEVEVLERHTSLDLDRPVVCDDDRKSLGLSQRNHTPDAPPIWTPSSPHSLRQDCNVSSEPGNDHSNTEVGSAAPDPLLDGLLSSAQNGEFHSTVIKLNHQEDSSSPQVNNVPHGGTLSTSPTAGRDVCRAVPAHRERLKAFSTAGPAGVISSWTSPNAFSPPVHPPSVSSTLQRSSPSVLPPDTQPSRTMQLDSLPLSIPAHLEDCGRPTGTAVLGSRHKGIDSEAGTSSSRTALGSLPSRLRTSAAQGTSMRARRRRRDPVPQSSNATSARSDLAPEASLSSSDDFPIATSRSSGLPLSQVSNFPDVSLARKDAKTQAVKRIPKSMPQPPPSRLVPELLDKSFIRSDKASLDEDDPPCASGKARKCRSPKDYRISSRPRDTSSPDCFRVLSGNSVSGFGSAALEWQDHDFEDLVFFIPPDCPMSTPVASRKRASRKVACRES